MPSRNCFPLGGTRSRSGHENSMLYYRAQRCYSGIWLFRSSWPRARKAEPHGEIMLTEQTRYRITGVVFLLALAIILLPMLFDGDGIEEVKLPDLPVDFIDLTLAEDLGPDPDMVSVLATRENLRKEIDADGYSVENGTKFGEPVLLVETDPLSPSSGSWAVQVASFSEEENALGLRLRLQTDGYNLSLIHISEPTRPY